MSAFAEDPPKDPEPDSKRQRGTPEADASEGVVETSAECDSEDSVTSKEVINWPDAMEQCGEDEEFLRELLGDLKDEVAENYGAIQEALDGQASGWADACRRAAHAVKGAAANLMCHQLNQAALELEVRAKAASTESTAEDFPDLTRLAKRLSAALERYVKYLEELAPMA